MVEAIGVPHGRLVSILNENAILKMGAVFAHKHYYVTNSKALFNQNPEGVFSSLLVMDKIHLTTTQRRQSSDRKRGFLRENRCRRGSSWVYQPTIYNPHRLPSKKKQ